MHRYYIHIFTLKTPIKYDEILNMMKEKAFRTLHFHRNITVILLCSY